MTTNHPIPLSLYIHLPWCIKKCPYCDFNSYATHPLKETPSFDDYVKRLAEDLEQDLVHVQDREIISIFFGGGTPSLFPVQSIARILDMVASHLTLNKQIEITLEANPGAIDDQKLKGFQAAGINRISLGAQSFQEDKLKSLGRVHGVSEIEDSLKILQTLNLNSFNIDLMYGLPGQTLASGLSDLERALSFDPPHLSWYHLTLEPNTIFHHSPPKNLPEEDNVWKLFQAGQELLEKRGYQHYEISAFSKQQHHCRHNLNYWQFGDYLGIGAGAHGKITTPTQNFKIERISKTRYPKSYLNIENSFIAERKELKPEDKTFEFLLNHLRLTTGFNKTLFESRTGQTLSVIEPGLKLAQEKKLLDFQNGIYTKTPLGTLFLNDLLQIFM